MKLKNLPLLVGAIGILAVAMIAPIHANYFASIFTRVDKASYLPGDSGTLFITVRNQGSQAITVKNITVFYPWSAFVTDHWDGNFTAQINQPLGQNQNYNGQFSFTVPTDGRGHSGDISITVGTDVPPPSPYSTLQTTAFVIVALAAYQPLSLATSALPIVTIVLLAVAVVMLFMVYTGISKLSKK